MTIIHTPWSIAPDNALNSEHAIQAAFICWARKAKLVGFALAALLKTYEEHPAPRLHKPEPDLCLLFAVPNGGVRGKRVALQLNLEGVLPGVSDILFLMPGVYGYTLVLEFKTPSTKNKTSPDQKKFLAAVKERGGGSFVVTSWREAAFHVITHLGGDGARLVPR